MIAGVEVTVGFDLASPDTIMSFAAAAAMPEAGVVNRSCKVAYGLPFQTFACRSSA